MDAAEVARTPLVTREPGSGTRDTAKRALREVGAQSPAPLLELGSTTAVRSTVRAGEGPALISELALLPDVAGGILVVVAEVGST